jgi:hypothetical protein
MDTNIDFVVLGAYYAGGARDNRQMAADDVW